MQYYIIIVFADCAFVSALSVTNNRAAILTVLALPQMNGWMSSLTDYLQKHVACGNLPMTSKSACYCSANAYMKNIVCDNRLVQAEKDLSESLVMSQSYKEALAIRNYFRYCCNELVKALNK